MRIMNKLEELINELCPNGVEYKKIGDVCDILRGKRLTKKELSDEGKYPVLHGGSSPMGYYNEYNRKANTTVVVNTGNAGSVFFYDKEFWSSDACFSIYPKDCLRDKFIFFFLSSNEHKLKSRIRYGAMPTIDSLAVETIKIPVPPLEVQDEIVKILDNFTLLTAELTAELTARQKQYAFYRDYLLDFSDEDVTKKTPDIDCSNVEYIKLKDVCKIGDGLHSTPIYDNNGSYYFINGNNLENGRITFTENTKRINISQYERYKIELDDATILMSINGTIGKIALYNREPIILGKSVAYFNVNERILKKYLYYLLQTNRSNAYYEKNLTGSTIKNLGLKALREYQIPLPPIDVQKNIIKILDRFDKLNNDMSEGLPAEIEARKKQYEYYRDTLLSFDDKACSQIVKVERERANTQ